jgi:hypothetical protein
MKPINTIGQPHSKSTATAIHTRILLFRFGELISSYPMRPDARESRPGHPMGGIKKTVIDLPADHDPLHVLSNVGQVSRLGQKKRSIYFFDDGHFLV